LGIEELENWIIRIRSAQSLITQFTSYPIPKPVLYMKKLKRLLIVFFLLAFIVLVAVLVYNAIKFSPKQAQVKPTADLLSTIISLLA